MKIYITAEGPIGEGKTKILNLIKQMLIKNRYEVSDIKEIFLLRPTEIDSWVNQSIDSWDVPAVSEMFRKDMLAFDIKMADGKNETWRAKEQIIITSKKSCRTKEIEEFTEKIEDFFNHQPELLDNFLHKYINHYNPIGYNGETEEK